MIHRRQKQRTPPPGRRRGSYCRATRSLPCSEIVAESKITNATQFLVADHQRKRSINLILETKISRYVWVRCTGEGVVGVVGRNGVHLQPWGHGLNKTGPQLDVSAPRRLAKVPDGGENVVLRVGTPHVIA